MGLYTAVLAKQLPRTFLKIERNLNYGRTSAVYISLGILANPRAVRIPHHTNLAYRQASR